LDFDHNIMGESDPSFIDDSIKVNKSLKKYSKKKLGELMNISDKLATLNYQRNQEFQEDFNEDNSRAAMYAFKGDVYLGLQAKEFKKRDIQYANKHLRILSGLYGLLKPMDKMQAYRLEMGTSLKVGRKKNLYEFWGSKIADEIKDTLSSHKNKSIINLASGEYFKAVKLDDLKDQVIEIGFKEYRDGKLKFISFNAKKARGLMSQYIIKNRISSIEDIKGFNLEDYAFDESLSSTNHLMFTR